MICAQTFIEGNIWNFSGKQAISGASVVLSAINGEDIGYCVSGKNGFYRIGFVSEEDSLILTVSSLGYETQTMCIKNQFLKINFRLPEKEIELKEVVIRSPPVWRKGDDTLVFRVDAFSSGKDRVIGDVLKKLPGFDVTDKGAITYNDKPINGFMIENLDLLGGKYRIATDNLPVDVVQNVEVIEHFEPVKALKDISDSDKIAVNLKLKKDRILKPFGTVSVGVGSFEDFLWDMNVFSMHLSGTHQSILTYKTNNTGNDLRLELTEFNIGVGIPHASPPTGLLHGDPVGNPPLKSNRYLFNNTHILSLNYLQKVADNKHLKLNVNYLRDKIEEKGEQNISYFLKDSALYIQELKFSERKSNEMDFSLEYKNNTDWYFINDRLNGKVNLIRSDVTVLNNLTMHEQYNLSEYLLENNLRLVKRFPKRALSIQSYVRYSSLPQSVDIYSDPTDSIIRQSVFRSGLYTTNKTSFSHINRKSMLSLNVNAEASLEQMNSELKSSQYADSTCNDLSFDYLRATLTPTYSYKSGDFSLSLQAPFVLQEIFIRDIVYKNKKDLFIFYINPFLQLRYEFNPFLTANVTSRYMTTQRGDLLDFTQSYIMLNYRNIQRTAFGILGKTVEHNHSAGINYQNMKFWFFNALVSYASTQSNVIRSLQFEGIGHSVAGNQQRNSRSSSWQYRLYGGKYISSIKSKISLTLVYALSGYENIQQSVIFPQVSEVFTLNPKIDLTIGNKVNVTYQMNCRKNNNCIKSDRKNIHSSLTYFSQNFSCYYALNDRLSVNMQVEYLRNAFTENFSKGSFFADSGLSYKTKNTEYSLLWSNIFNQKEYVYTTQSLNIYNYHYYLRPANLLAKIIFKY
jgi:hypothetical protein